MQAYGYAGKYVAGGGAGPIKPAGEGIFGHEEVLMLRQSVNAEGRMSHEVDLDRWLTTEEDAKAQVSTRAAADMLEMSKSDPALKEQLEKQVSDTDVFALQVYDEWLRSGTIEEARILEESEIERRHVEGIISINERDWMLSQRKNLQSRLDDAEAKVWSMARELHIGEFSSTVIADNLELLTIYRNEGLVGIGARLSAQRYVSQWAASAADRKPLSVAGQIVAADVFGVSRESIGWAEDKFDTMYAQQELDATVAGQGVALAAFHVSVYNHTQAVLKAAGITEITLVRGVDAELTSGKYKMSPLNAFSTDPGTAMAFGNGPSMIMTTVPAERIYSGWMTGPGCRGEHEIIVVGSDAPDEFVVWKKSEVNARLLNQITSLSGEHVRVGEGLIGEPSRHLLPGVDYAVGPGTYWIDKPSMVEAGYVARKVTSGKNKGKWGVYKR